MSEKYDPNALWVALSEHNHENNLFDVYSKLLSKLYLEEEAARQDGDTSEAEKLVLPSDKEWRLQLYFYMVSLQKGVRKGEDAEDLQVQRTEEAPEEWAPWNLVVQTKNARAPPPVAVRTVPGPVWDIRQVLKAAKLLCKPPRSVEFIDEQDMRCVYSLIYDCFRYKTVLDQTLDDVDFIGDFPQFAEHRHALWLFLLELARRRWGARTRGDLEVATQLLEEAGSPLKEIENEIWHQRVHFAAAIARIRIKNKAFALSDLLPEHLRDERVNGCANKPTVTGWVNTFKAKKVALLVKHLHNLGYSYSNSPTLCAGEYRFDRVCPRFITLRPPVDVSIGQLDLVREGVIVLQEREFCEGASTLCRALRINSLCGVVAQTHASSPRCSAYLAAQLRELAAVIRAKAPAAPITPQLGRLVVFGAGDKVESYVDALRKLGIEASILLHSDAPVRVLKDAIYCDTPDVASALDDVVAVLATPPNSYSAVTDPIDLVCGRGGDLAMLEVLTESSIDEGQGMARVQSILEEQKKTLRTLMSKPQIQLIMYETHSALEAENKAQVTRAISEANRLARERHALLKRKHRAGSPTKQVSAIDLSGVGSVNMTQPDSETEEDRSPKQTASTPSTIRSDSQTAIITRQSECNISRPGTNKARPIPAMPQPDAEAMPTNPDLDFADVDVPDCDLFEVGVLPTIGNGLDINYILDRDGCYLGLIQRKVITKLDAKFMIQVAEERGLFGSGAAPAPRRKRPDHAPAHKKRNKMRKPSFEVDRVAAPTYASMLRSSHERRGSAPAAVSENKFPCEKHARRQAAAMNAVGCGCNAHHRAPPMQQSINVHMQITSNRDITNMKRDQHVKYNRSEKVPYRRASADASVAPSHKPPCRRPYPVVVKEVLFRKITPNKILYERRAIHTNFPVYGLERE